MSEVHTTRRPFGKWALPLLVGLAVSVSGCGVLGKKKLATPTVGNRVPVLSRIESGDKVDPSLASIAVVVPPAAANADWPQAGNLPSKSYGNLALASAPARIWTQTIEGSSKRQRLAASPVIGGGKIFAMDTAGIVHAWDAATGSPRWTQSFKISGDGSSSVFGGGVSFDDGKAYVTTGVGEVAALDAETGKVLWKVKPAGPLRGSPTIAFDAVYVMTQDNQLVALNAPDGAQLWTQSGSNGLSGIFGVAAPTVGQGSVLAGFSTGELVAYRYENGRTLWGDALARTSLSTTVGVLTDIDADPIIDNGRVYALGQGGRMAAYELVSGQRIWELNLAGISTPAVAGDWIFVLTDQAKLLCISRATGKVRWATALPAWRNAKKKKGPIFWTGPVLAGDRLWIANTQGQIMSANITDGAATELTNVGKPISLAPVVAGNTLYILDDGGRLTAFK